jgi:hypothetical protein
MTSAKFGSKWLGTKSMRALLPFLLFIFVVPSLQASGTEGGTGMLFGEDHAFYFTAPDGWVLDNQSGVSHGLHMLFYPVGYTWANSPVFAYGVSVSKTAEIRTVQNQVEATIKEFHTRYESPNSRSKRQAPMLLPNGVKIEIYFFEGDKWGNYEAAGYVEEKETINFLVYSSRTRLYFDSYLGDFKKLLISYKNVFNKWKPLNDEAFNKLRQEAKTMVSTSRGKEYELQVMKSFGQDLANFMQGCTSYTPREEMKNFEIIFRIEPNGEVSEVFILPKTTLSQCFMGLVLNSTQPPHKFKSFLQHIEMHIED